MYNIQGLQGLTAAERQDWEKEQLSNIGADFTNYSDEHKDRLYRNQKFYEAFGTQENYSELSKMIPAERDRYYSDWAFHNSNKDNMSVQEMVQLSPQDRDAQYNSQYAFSQLKDLYGDTDVWQQVTYKDKEGNDQPLFETETMQELLRSGIKPESEIADYERAGYLGNVYNSGQKVKADSSLALMQGTGVADNTTSGRVFTMLKKSLMGGIEGLLTIGGELVNNAVTEVKGLYDAVVTGDEDKFNDAVAAVRNRPAPIKAGLSAAYDTERTWLREANQNIWDELRDRDYKRKLEVGKDYIDATAQELQNLAYFGGDEGRAKVDEHFNNLMENSPYFREFKDTKYLRNLTYDQKAKMAAEAMYMMGAFGPETYLKYTDDNTRNFIAESMNAGDRIANGAFDIFAQATAGMMGAVVAMESIGTGVADTTSDDYDSDTFRRGFNADGTQKSAFWNPIYWNSVSQYGTFDWNEIKRIKYGIGNDEYQKYVEQKKQDDPVLTDQQIEDMWISEQWEQGRFRGDQVSKHTNVYKTTEENDAIGLSTLYGGLGMSGQVLSQFLLGRGIGFLGKAAKASATAARMSRVASSIDRISPYSEIMFPTLPISEAYAQGAYEKSIMKNREALDNYINTSEAQQEITNRYNANSEYYKNLALQELGEEAAANVNAEVVAAKARAIAEEEYRSQWYGQFDEGAKAAFWTSFAIEGIRYGMFNMFNRQWIFGDASRKIRGISPDVKITRAGAKPNVEGVWGTVKDVSKNAAKEMWNSGRTNYCDELTTGFAVGFGTNLPSDYMGRIRQNNPEFDGVYGALLNGFHDLVDVADDATSIQAFTTGSLGFLVGGNMANIATAWAMPSVRAQYSDAERMERLRQGLPAEMSSTEARQLLRQKLGLEENEYGTGRKALEWAAYLTGNSALLNVSERLQRVDDAQRVASSINRTLADNAAVLDSDKAIREMSALVAAREAAAVSGDEMTKKNENYKDIFHTLKVLNQMREQGQQDTAPYEDFMELMRGYAEGRITEDDVQSFLHNPENEAYTKSLGNEEQQAAYAKERIQKNAEKFLEVNEAWQRNKSIIDNNLGDLSKSQNEDAQDFYYDLLFKMSWSEDANERLANMEEAISGSRSSNESTTPMIQRHIATTGGNMEFVQGLLQEISGRVTKIKADLSKEQNFLRMSSKRRNMKAETLAKHQENARKLQNELDRWNRLSDRYNEQLSRYQEVTSEEAKAWEDTAPIPATQLLALNPEERLFVFTHPEVFSKRQQAQIEKARTTLMKSIGSDYLEQLRDVHVLGQRVALNDEYIARALSGEGIQEALDAIHTTKTSEVVKTIQWLAEEKMKSLVPLIGKRVTKKLLGALVGIPVNDITKYAQFGIKDPAKLKVLDDALAVLRGIKSFDYAIEIAGLSDADKRRASDLIYSILSGAKEITDIPKLMSSYLASHEDSPEYDLLSKVLNKAAELQSQASATTDNGTEEVKKEGQEEAPTAKEEKKLGAEEQLIEKNANKEIGEYKSLTPEEVATIIPDVAPVSTHNSGEVSTDSRIVDSSVNTQGTTLQGNWVNGYDVTELRKTGKQVAKKGDTENSTFSRWLDWTSLNGYRYQDVVDFELAKIIESNPDMPVHMMVVQGIGEATKDSLVGDAVMLVVEATDAVKRIHNEEYGHYVSSNGKEYLIIGRTGLEAKHTQEQEDNFNRMYKEISAEKKTYFEANPTERFYVSDKYSTQVRYINGGVITTSLIGENQSTHDIAEMLGDAKRDPFGIKKIENMGWYIQVGSEAREPIGLPGKVVRDGRYYIPADRAFNSGALFAMVPIGNGKYMPIKVNAATLATIKDGKFKDIVKAVAERIASPDYNTRHDAVVELLKLVVLDNNNNILIGTDDINAVSIVREGETQPAMRIGEVPSEAIVNAIMSVPFRININQTTFQDPVRVKQLADAGAFTTDIAVLGGTGNNFTVYACDENGNPMVETSSIGNESYVHTVPTRDITVPYKGATARMKNGQWVVEEVGKDTRVVVSPTEKAQLDYAAQILNQGLTPVTREGNFDYYIISADTTNPVAAKMDRNTHEVVIPSKNAMLELINRVEAERRNRDAAAELQEQNEIRNQRGTQMVIGEETLSTEESNEEKYAKGKPMTIGESTDSKEKTSVVEEKVQETTKNVSQNLRNPEKSSTFVEVFGNFEYYEAIENLLLEKFGNDLIYKDSQAISDFLEKKGIPVVGITDIDAWLDLVRNCK